MGDVSEEQTENNMEVENDDMTKNESVLSNESGTPNVPAKRGRGRPPGSTRSKTSGTQKTKGASSSTSTTPRIRFQQPTHPTPSVHDESEPSSSSVMSKRSSIKGFYPFDDDERSTYPCPKCEFIGDSRATRNFHMRQDHQGYVYEEGDELKRPIPIVRQHSDSTSPIRGAKRGRPRKSELAQRLADMAQPIITTKQLISGSAPRVRRIQGLSQSHDDYEERKDIHLNLNEHEHAVDSKGNSHKNQNEPMHVVAAGEIEVGASEELVGENYEVEEQEQNDYFYPDMPGTSSGNRHRTRNMRSSVEKKKQRTKAYPPEKIPDRLRVGDVNGKYQCYKEGCEWRGNYRSLRMQHMRTVHPEWEMPDRFLLQRITRDGLYIDPSKFVPPLACLVVGCGWRGNYRATRSSHIRQCHPDVYEQNKKKAALGGYLADGSYYCHIEDCAWRGSSRSTRASHMRREHPDWKSDFQKERPVSMECFECGHSHSSSMTLIAHVNQFHGLGQHVDMKFESRLELELFIKTIERIYRVNFVRKPSFRQTSGVNKYMLVCDANGTKGRQISQDARSAAYKTNYLGKRQHRIITRRSGKVHCCMSLEIKENVESGIFTATGCIEHTGHLWGTPLIRFSVLDRQLMHEYMKVRFTDNPMTLMDALEVLKTIEGFTIDTMVAVPRMDTDFVHVISEDDEIVSLYRMTLNPELVPPNSLFNVQLVNDGQNDMLTRCDKLSIGLMTDEMKRCWIDWAHNGLTIVENVNLELGSVKLMVYYVIVLAEAPRCCCVYLTNKEDGHLDLLQYLHNLDARSPLHMMTDVSNVWIDDMLKVYGDHNCELQITEWSLMDYWMEKISEVVENDMEQVYIMCAMRRLLRVQESSQFEFYVVELFEAFHEMGHDSLIKWLDYQLSDMYFFRRWSPMLRVDVTQHNNPTLGIICQYFRERFLDPSGVGRIDEYFALVMTRVHEFNCCPEGEAYTLRPLDQERSIMYATVYLPETSRTSKPHSQPQDHPDAHHQVADVGQLGLYRGEDFVGHEVVDDEYVMEREEAEEHDVRVVEPTDQGADYPAQIVADGHVEEEHAKRSNVGGDEYGQEEGEEEEVEEEEVIDVGQAPVPLHLIGDEIDGSTIVVEEEVEVDDVEMTEHAVVEGVGHMRDIMKNEEVEKIVVKKSIVKATARLPPPHRRESAPTAGYRIFADYEDACRHGFDSCTKSVNFTQFGVVVIGDVPHAKVLATIEAFERGQGSSLSIRTMSSERVTIQDQRNASVTSARRGMGYQHQIRPQPYALLPSHHPDADDEPSTSQQGSSTTSMSTTRGLVKRRGAVQSRSILGTPMSAMMARQIAEQVVMMDGRKTDRRCAPKNSRSKVATAAKTAKRNQTVKPESVGQNVPSTSSAVHAAGIYSVNEKKIKETDVTIPSVPVAAAVPRTLPLPLPTNRVQHFNSQGEPPHRALAALRQGSRPQITRQDIVQQGEMETVVNYEEVAAHDVPEVGEEQIVVDEYEQDEGPSTSSGVRRPAKDDLAYSGW